MPSFSFSSSIRVASQEHVLRLKITHNLVHGSPSDDIHRIKGRLPKELDVLWLSDITISLSGSFDSRQVTAQDMTSSGLAQYFRTQLKTNADRLGLNNVSRLYVDDADGLSKLMLTPSRPLPNPSRPYANLVSLHLAYIWGTVPQTDGNSSQLFKEADPFSSTLFLPAKVLLNRVTDQFLINHFAGRYPLIFGPWCKKLDLEMQYFPSIGNSIVQIMNRSEDRFFSSKCRHLLNMARKQYKFVLQASASALSSCADGDFIASKEEVDDLPLTSVLTDERVLCESLEQLFRVGVSQRRFKPVVASQRVTHPQDDDDVLIQSAPDEGSDAEVSWVELPEIMASPVADYCQTFAEDMNMIAEEDWFEDEIWHPRELYERDTSLADTNLEPLELTLCKTQSEESLIDDTDYPEPDPAASGMWDKRFRLSCQEEPGMSASFANQTDTPIHDYCFSEDDEQLTQDMGEIGEEDSDSILFEVDDDNLDWLA